MAKKDRTGNRKTRDQRKQFKTPELGYYLIVTDTEATERCFFTGLHQAMPEDVRNKLVIKVIETKTRTMIDKCMELMAYDAQYRIPWIVFDRDQVQWQVGNPHICILIVKHFYNTNCLFIFLYNISTIFLNIKILCTIQSSSNTLSQRCSRWYIIYIL